MAVAARADGRAGGADLGRGEPHQPGTPRPRAFPVARQAGPPAAHGPGTGLASAAVGRAVRGRSAVLTGLVGLHLDGAAGSNLTVPAKRSIRTIWPGYEVAFRTF